MVIRGVLLSVIWMGLIPLCIGMLCERKSEHKMAVEAWVYGTIAMMAVAQIVLVPLIALRKQFSLALLFWLVGIAALLLGAIYWLWRNKKRLQKRELRLDIKRNAFVWLVLAVVLAQCAIAAVLQHSDADDSRFIAEAVIATEQDSMYVISPISGQPMYKVDYLGDVKKDLTSPWVMYVAFLAKMCGVAPAIFAHSIMPFYLVLFCYAVYTLIGQLMFDRDGKKTALFVLFLSVFFAFDFSSTHTVGTVMLFRIWQGKAFAAAGIVPVFFYLILKYLLEAKKLENTREQLCMMTISCFAASLVSGSGILLSLLLVFVFGITAWVCLGKGRAAISIWLTGLPSFVYLVCQYKYWQVFVAPWFG